MTKRTNNLERVPVYTNNDGNLTVYGQESRYQRDPPRKTVPNTPWVGTLVIVDWSSTRSSTQLELWDVKNKRLCTMLASESYRVIGDTGINPPSTLPADIQLPSEYERYYHHEDGLPKPKRRGVPAKGWMTGRWRIAKRNNRYTVQHMTADD